MDITSQRYSPLLGPSPPHESREPTPVPSPPPPHPTVETPARTSQASASPSNSTMTRSTLTSGDADQSRRHSSGPSGRGSVSPTKDRGRSKVQLEDFELIRVLGKGCAGRVLLVRHSRQNTVHAMKAISKRSVLASDELPHILTELSILKRFAIYEPHSDFVTRLNYSFTDRENFYFVMDFYPGGDLATQLEMFGTLGHVRTRFYAADLVLGLEDLHRHGVILRDLKPENILLNASGHCVIADFGLSKEFDYRGEPQPLHVPLYQGEMVLPHWAGAGAGSLRLSPAGKKRIVMDRAWSFVGTTEYLAPEVVRGHEYSYAVDWWGLGCILFECLLGRVPFRKDDDEPPQVLYNRILFESWDHMFEEPRHKRKTRVEMGLDAVTEGFLDGLLQKDPMRRLTEPCVRDHFYFSQIDWDNVRSGDYVDPHELHLHPLAEYNTRYFPKLCLEQDPNVDMSTHNREESDQSAETDFGRRLTALNHENTYKFEQAKCRKELEGFYWSREEWLMELEELEEAEAEEAAHAAGAGMVIREGSETTDSGSGSGSGSSMSLAEPEGEMGGDDVGSIVSMEVDEAVPVVQVGEETGMGVEEPTVKINPEGVVQPPPRTVTPGSVPESTAEIVPEASAQLPPQTNTPKLIPVPLSGAMSSMQLSSPATSPERLITPHASTQEIPLRIENHSGADSSPAKVDLLRALETVKPAKAETEKAPSANTASSESVSPAPLGAPIASRTAATSHKPIPIPILRPKPDTQPTRLPSGLPASGLSVSDVISIPSPTLDAAPRLIRRHPHLQSVDSVPASRLSVDLHGTITQLGEDDWEALEGDADIPSAPNGYGPSLPPSSFFTRLRRRPSTIMTSGLRRQAQATRSTSDSSSRESSPTKGLSTRPLMFGGTKKALGKLKAFPLLSRRNSENQPDMPAQRGTAGSLSPSPSTGSVSVGMMTSVSAGAGPSASAGSRKPSPGLNWPERPRPEAPRRHTESGWFERKISRKYSKRAERTGTQSSEGSSSTGDERAQVRERWGTMSDLMVKESSSSREVGPPRVELQEMGASLDLTFGEGRGTATGTGGNGEGRS